MKNKKTIIAIVSVVMIFAVVAVVYLTTRKNEEGETVMVTETTPAVTTVVSETAIAETEETTVTTPEYPPFVNGLSLKAQEARYSNADTVGWIRISNTVIDYPLVKTDNNDYYIDHNFYKNSDSAGWVFMDFRCKLDQENYSSQNILLYGHNMADGSMFSDLKDYQRYESFYEENPIIELSSLEADYQYKIFAFMLCNGVHGSDFEFWNYVDFTWDSNNPKWSASEYLSKIDDKSLITTNVDVREDDKFLLLSTCNSGDTTDHTRFVVLARRVRPGEDAYEGTTGSVRRY